MSKIVTQLTSFFGGIQRDARGFSKALQIKNTPFNRSRMLAASRSDRLGAGPYGGVNRNAIKMLLFRSIDNR